MISANEAKANAIKAQEIISLRAIQAEIERQTRFSALVTDTIAFCNGTLSVMIANASNEGDNYLSLYWGRDTSSEFDDVFSELDEEKEKYANGDSSYTIKGNDIHVPTMVAYLMEHDYTVEQFDWTYMCYGHGCQTGTRIRIQWNP
jgi:hypothetical protein